MNGILIENKTATIPLTRIAVAHFWKTGDFIDAVCIITVRSIEFGVCSNYQLRTTNLALFFLPPSSLIRLYYFLNQRVPHHVFFRKIGKPYAFNTLQYLLSLHKTGWFCKRKVYLCYIPCYHRSRTKSEPCQKHLHLFGCCVLRLIHYHKRIVQCPAAHKCKRRNFYRSPLYKLFCPFKINHIVKRIIERPEIWVNLLSQITRQKPKLLPCLYCWPGEDYPLHLSFG